MTPLNNVNQNVFSVLVKMKQIESRLDGLADSVEDTKMAEDLKHRKEVKHLLKKSKAKSVDGALSLAERIVMKRRAQVMRQAQSRSK